VDRQALQRLGAGGGEDRLGFRLVLKIFVRCLGLLRGVRRHVVLLMAGAAAFIPLLIVPAAVIMDLLWTRVLEGQPLTGLQATWLRLDPAAVARVDSLDDATRRDVARRGLALVSVVVGLAVPVILAFSYYYIWILQRLNQLLRLELLERLNALSLRFHQETRVGDAIYRIYQDSAMATRLIEVMILSPLAAAFWFLLGLATVAALAPKFALLLLAGVPVMLAIGAWWSRPLRIGFRRARESNSGLTSRIQETVQGIRVIKAFGAEGLEQQRFEDASRSAFDAAYGARSNLAVYGVLLFWVLGLVLITGNAWGALETQQGRELFARQVATWLGFSTWTLGLYNFFKERLGGSGGGFRQLLRIWGAGQDVAIGLDRVFEVLDLEPEVEDAADAVELPGVREGVAFRNVCFRYQSDRAGLEGIDLEARLGSVTAIVGPTGSGKSTLMSLLLRLFEPDAGAIEIDGADLRRFRIQSLRAKVAIALQENILFGASVRENIRYAVPDASDAAVRAAARVACADEFIEALPEGYDTLLGERGTKLSTGQRQRLSIARAVLKDAPILVLDEPTASLDAATELRVLRNLALWGRERVIFLITHRLGTVRRADQIAVLQDGKIVEIGSHADLLARDEGTYRRHVGLEEALT
jgi:ATP-binding cassette subfamily B protein